MSNFGCFYNPRPAPGRCIKDIRSSTVESQCEIKGTNCVLKTKEEEKVEETKIEEKTIFHIEEPGKITSESGNQYLSGPVSAYVTKYNDTKYEFFGDMHFSFEKSCDMPCKDIDPSMKGNTEKNPIGSKNCWTISALLNQIFKESSEKQEYVDFYLEIPFMSVEKNRSLVDKEDVFKKLQDNIYKLFAIFYDCFLKLNCPYKYVRFHYVDVRLEYKVVDYPTLLENMNIAIERSIVTEFSNFELYLTKKLIDAAMKRLILKLDANDKSPDSLIEKVDKIMKEMYYSGGQTLIGTKEPKNVTMMKIYFNSDNFARDIVDLMSPVLKDLPAEEALIINEALVLPYLIVNRRGKNMHRIRAQLEALENEGQGELAKKISDFLLHEYEVRSDNSKIITIWDKFMKLYREFISGRNISLQSTERIFDNILKEYKNIVMSLGLTISSSSLMMDAYLLARMFRKYPDKNHVRGKYSIVYAGDKHIETYVRFFQYVLGSNFIAYDPNKDLEIEDV